jgi:hypothetical protein
MRKGILMAALVALVAFGFTGMNTVQAEGVVAGAVIDQDGAPVEGAHVVLVAAVRERGERPFHARGESAENGGFMFEEVPAGEYFISAGMRDAGHVRAEIEVSDDQVTEIQLQLEAFEDREDEEVEFGSVSGVVLDAEGEPVARAMVAIMPNFREMRGVRGMRGHRGRLFVMTDREGAFAFDEVPAGNHNIIATAMRVGMVRGEVAVEADQNTEIELQFEERGGGNGGGGRGDHGGGGGIINNRNQGIRSAR